MAHRRRTSRLALATLVVVVASSSMSRARAFTFDSPVSDACHERITEDASTEIGWPGGASPPALSHADRVLRDDLPFPFASRIRDPWMLSLILGVRYNDLHGAAATDLPRLARVHNDPHTQDEHCLRAPADDGADGDGTALASCRAFIVRQLEQALGVEREIDTAAVEHVEVRLSFRGTTEVPVLRFAFRLGRALHALQDSFTHTFRDPADLRIRHVLNFVDWAVADSPSEATDGHPHIAELDLCDGATEARRRRVHGATDASIALVSAIFGEGTRLDRLTRAEAALDGALAMTPGCTADNDWCGATEPDEMASCATTPGRPRAPRGTWALFALLAIAALAMRRSRRSISAVFGSIAFVLVVLHASIALAQPRLPRRDDRACGERTEHPTCCRLSGILLGGAGIDRGGFAIVAGARLTVSKRLTVGLAAEWNPWFSIEGREMAAGVTSVYTSFLFTWLRHDGIELRSTGNLGMSVLLFDLVGAPAGSFGPFLGGTLLGVAIRLTDHWHLLIEPDDVAFPIPKVTGVPYYYLQYRVLIGVEWRP